MNNYFIRKETENDYSTVENLTREAFWNVYRPGCVEHYVLHKLRDDDCFIPDLDYVLEQNGNIIAHIAYAKATVTDDNGEKYEVAIFGPVSVLPEMQGKGYGSALIRHTIDHAKQMGIPMILITGNPDYYHRFGFVPASTYGVYYDGTDRAEEAPFFMAKILDETKAANIKGTYADPVCYFVSDEDVDEFDKNFPPKIKERREGQLL